MGTIIIFSCDHICFRVLCYDNTLCLPHNLFLLFINFPLNTNFFCFLTSNYLWSLFNIYNYYSPPPVHICVYTINCTKVKVKLHSILKFILYTYWPICVCEHFIKFHPPTATASIFKHSCIFIYYFVIYAAHNLILLCLTVNSFYVMVECALFDAGHRKSALQKLYS